MIMFLKLSLKVIIHTLVFYWVTASEDMLQKNSSKSLETLLIRYWPDSHPCKNETNISLKYCIGVVETDKKTTFKDVRFTCHEKKSYWDDNKSSDRKLCDQNDVDVIGDCEVFNITANRDLSSIKHLEASYIDSNYMRIYWIMFNRQFYSAIFNLAPCTTYDINVVSCDGSFEYTQTIRERTKMQTPSKIRNLNITEISTPLNTSLRISWDPPEIGSTCISYYIITLSIHNTRVHYKKILPPSNSVIATDLSACKVYTVMVNLYDINLEEGTAVVKQAPLTSYRVVREPRIVENWHNEITSSSIKLQWNVTDENNYCPDPERYLLCECCATGTDGYGYELKNSSNRFKMKFYSGIVETTSTELSPFTNYTCRASIFNKVGPSSWSSNVSLMTDAARPSPPQNFTAVSLNDTAVRISWEPSKYMPAELHFYFVRIIGYVTYKRPESCYNTGVVNKFGVLGKNSNAFDYICPLNYASYSVILSQHTTDGLGNAVGTRFQNTAVKAPGKVENFTYVIRPRTNFSNELETILSWESPCLQNGILDYFYVNISGSRNNFPIHKIEEKISIPDKGPYIDSFTYRTDEVKPQYQYIFKVVAATRDVSEHGEAAEHIITCSGGIPPKPDDDYLKKISFDPYKTKRSSTTAVALLPLFPNTNGDILYYAVLVTEKGFGTSDSRRYNLSLDNWPNASCWKEAQEYDFKVTYQPTKEYWDPYTNKDKYILNYGNLKAVKYMLGDDPECESVSYQNPNRTVYCNGPLKSDTWYEVRLRGFTDGGYADSIPVLVRTKAPVQVATVVGIVGGILTLGTAFTVLVVFFRTEIAILLGLRKIKKIFS